MKTKIVDIQEFNTSQGLLRFETRIAEENNFRSVVDNKVIFNGTEFSSLKALEDKLDCHEYDMLIKKRAFFFYHHILPSIIIL